MPHNLFAARNLIFPALITPLMPDGALDTASAERLIAHLYQQGVGGLYVTGSTGEGVYLDHDTRRKMVELSVAMSRGKGQVIAHVGAIEGSQAYQMAEHAHRAGADVIASIPPFVGGYRWEEVFGYYRRLCETSATPVLGYYIPDLTGQEISTEQLASLAELPNLCGFKVTDTNLYRMQRIGVRLRGDQVLFNGPDELLALGLAQGAHGGIGTTYNFMPKLILEIASHVTAGRIAEAVGVQKKVNDVIEVLLGFPPLAATKQILVWQGLIAHPTLAAPRLPLTDGQCGELRKRLERTAIADTLKRG